MKASVITVVGLALAQVPAPALAQAGSADILTGVVRDSAGKPIAEAVVEATSLESGISRSTRTDPRGRYTIVFPDGGGQYRLQVRYIGMQSRMIMVIRKADEDRLVTDVSLSSVPTRLAEINVRAARPPPGEGITPGELARMLPPELLRRLPLDASDLNLIATLAPGVVAVDATDSTAAGFSVAGQRPSTNAVTLDGMLFSGGTLPSEGLRSVRVITNTFDVSRGQFSGGLISTSTRSGTNSPQGSWFYGLRDRGLEIAADTAAAFGRGYTQHQLSGGLGGPLIRNHLFAFVSGQGRLRSDDLASLLAASPPTLERLGAEPDSVARFLHLLDAKGLNGATTRRYDNRATDDGSTLARLDWLVSSSHTLTVRGDWRKTRQDPTRISPLALEQTGATVRGESGGGLVALTSRFGTTVVNEAKAYVSRSTRETRGLAALPQGRVQLASELSDGRQSVATLTFGGTASAPQDQSDHALELSDEFSWLPGGGAHRIKLGGLLSLTSTRQNSTVNRFGTYTYTSLADFAADQPASFTRTMASAEVEGSSANSALWLGDTWRPGSRLQLTYGVRAERSVLGGTPAYQPTVEQLFGRRTDRFPEETHVSPRLGFTWTAASREGRLPRTVIRGGVGEFRSPLPVGLGSAARAASGGPGGERQLFCVGPAVPLPDWSQFASDPGSIPSACTDAVIPAGTTRAPSVTVFAPDFGAARSVRSALGIQRRLGELSSLSLDLSYAWGLSQSGFTDLNLATTPRFILGDEGGRPVYVAPDAIQPATGAVGLIGSRLHPSYGQVLSLDSDLRSRAFQVTVGGSGFSRKGMVYQASYTYSRARDQSSGGGWSLTGGNPNLRKWARSDFERRHSFLLNLTYPVTRALEIGAIGRLSSGVPYSPRVGGDINGDGLRNDLAFVFDPAKTPDSAVADGMTRLLQRTSSGARDCLSAQLGGIASRNSCSGPWQPGLDVQVNWRPSFLGLDRRLMISMVTVNFMGGLDALLHDADHRKGWGQAIRPDPTLLYVRGFDPLTSRFLYTVNERFGATDAAANAFRVPFQLGLQVRYSLGPDRVRDALRALRGDLPGGRGGQGGRNLGGPGRAGLAGFAARLDSLAPNPAKAVLGLADSLGLTPDQRALLRPIADSLDAVTGRVSTGIREQLQRAGSNPDPGAFYSTLRPRLVEIRAAVERGVVDTRAVLTPEQWAKVPESIRSPAWLGPTGQQRGSRPPRP